MIDNSPAVFVVHTTFVLKEMLERIFAELAPEVALRHIVDDSLLKEVIQHGAPTPGVQQRMESYFLAAESAGADVILSACSSVREVAQVAASKLRVPLVNIDWRMAERAVEMGKTIGVAATLPTTLGPTCRLVEGIASDQGRKVEIVESLCGGAYEHLLAGDPAGHNRMLLDGIRKLAERVDVVVCAQGSMATLLSDLEGGGIKTPILTSPRLGVEHTLEVLREWHK